MKIYGGIEDYVRQNGEFPKSLQKIKKEKVLKEIEKLIPDFRQYYLEWEFEEMSAEDLVYSLEHEMDLYRNWKEEGFHSKDKVSNIVNTCGARRMQPLINRCFKML